MLSAFNRQNDNADSDKYQRLSRIVTRDGDAPMKQFAWAILTLLVMSLY